MERRTIVTSFFGKLADHHGHEFGGFTPSEELIDDIVKIKLAPGQNTKCHRGVGPLAFTDRSIAETDEQASQRSMVSSHVAHVSLTYAEARAMDSKPPAMPTTFDKFLLVLRRFTNFHLQAFGPRCDLVRKTNAVVKKLTSLRDRIERSHGDSFMVNRAPTIIWELTIATRKFFDDAKTSANFSLAAANGDDDPYVEAPINVDALGDLSTVTCPDLPDWLRPPAALPSPPARPSTAPSRSSSQAPAPAARSRATPRSSSTPTSAAPAFSVNPNHSPGFATLFATVPQDKRDKISLRKILAASPGVDYDVLVAKLATHGGTCLRYHIVGSCGLRTCHKEHSALNMPPGAVDTICTLLRPGLQTGLPRS
jgi:hypothetical protein